MFFNLNVFNERNICIESLSNLCNILSSENNISLSSQSLHERFNERSVCFLEKVFLEILSNKIGNLKSDISSDFNRIIITDSTGFQLPDEYEEIFRGFSGSASKSGIKIQLTNDLLTGNILSLELSDGRKSDGKHLKTLEKLTTKGDLALKDLGYYSLKHLKEIETLDSYYISRLKLNSSLYLKNPTPEKFKDGKVKEGSKYLKLDLVKECEKLQENEIRELNVYIGRDNLAKIKSRAIIYKLPDDITEKKTKDQEKMACKKGITVSKKLKSLNNVNIFITNVESKKLPKEIIYLMYSLRWQIEIMFKIWKSIFNIDKIKKVKKERFLCHLYGTLISILLSTELVFSIRNSVYTNLEKEISEYKSFKTVKIFLNALGMSLLKPYIDMKLILDKIINMILKNGIKSKRKNKKNPCEILKLIRERRVLYSVDVA